jgi:hypothetical protein
VVPFALGFLATARWPTPSVAGLLGLGVVAGITEAVVEGLLMATQVTIRGERLALASEDYVARGAIVCLFVAGGLYQVRRSGRSAKVGSTMKSGISAGDWLRTLEKTLSIVGALCTICAALG